MVQIMKKINLFRTYKKKAPKKSTKLESKILEQYERNNFIMYKRFFDENIQCIIMDDEKRKTKNTLEYQ